MTIVHSSEQCNPEQISRQFTSLVDNLKSNVQAAAEVGDGFDNVERSVLTSVLQIGQQALQLFISLQEDGNLGEDIQTENGQTARRSQETSSTTVRSIFGEHPFDQFVCAPGKNKAICLRPISARMSLPARRWSFLLQEFSQMLGVDQAYDQAMKNLGRFLGGRFSVDTPEQINGRMGVSAGEFLANLPLPDWRSACKRDPDRETNRRVKWTHRSRLANFPAIGAWQR